MSLRRDKNVSRINTSEPRAEPSFRVFTDDVNKLSRRETKQTLQRRLEPSLKTKFDFETPKTPTANFYFLPTKT